MDSLTTYYYETMEQGDWEGKIENPSGVIVYSYTVSKEDRDEFPKILKHKRFYCLFVWPNGKVELK